MRKKTRTWEEEQEYVKSRWLEASKNHEMQVVYDDGCRREVIFKSPGSGDHWFGLKTWPWHICIYGDIGTYVFSRVEDMFTFFRRDELSVNEGYWHEKLKSISRFGGDKEFSISRFREVIRSAFESYCSYSHDVEDLKELEMSEEDLKEKLYLDEHDIALRRELQSLWEEIESDVIGRAEDDGNEYSAYDHAYGFRSYDTDLKPRLDFSDCDLWDYGGFTDYTFQYRFVLYAIVWGIQKYDSEKDKGEVVENVTNS